MDISMHDTNRLSLQRLRELTTELYALTVEVSGYANGVRTGQPNGSPINSVDSVKAAAMLGKITETTTLLREEAYRLRLEPEPVH
jgi:hypothetical protein